MTVREKGETAVPLCASAFSLQSLLRADVLASRTVHVQQENFRDVSRKCHNVWTHLWVSRDTPEENNVIQLRKTLWYT